MTISDYLKDKDISQRELARKCGVSYQCINHAVVGRRAVSFSLAKKIVRATGGDIQYEDLLDFEGIAKKSAINGGETCRG